MWNWIWFLLLSITGLLLIEEISQFIWRSYLKNPAERQETIFSRFLASAKQRLHKDTKDPSH